MADTPKPTIDSGSQPSPNPSNCLSLNHARGLASSTPLWAYLPKPRRKLKSDWTACEPQVKTDVRLDRLFRVVARHEQQLDAYEG